MENIQKQIEDKVIDCINLGVAGRLIIFKPENNKSGVDLAVERRGKYKEGAIYFQINSFIGPSEDKVFTKDFFQEGFRPNKDFNFIFVYFDELKQKLSDYVWLIPSFDFRDLAEVIKSSDGNLLRFEVTADIKSKNKYSKFIVATKDLGKLVLDALEKGGKFDFKDLGLNEYSGEKRAVNLEDLKEFLFEARESTYAAGANPIDNPRLLSSEQLEFQKGDYFYRDIFFDGEKNFIGQEIIYFESKPIWGMNYFGAQIGKVETNFLRETLTKLSNKCRIGGICEYKKREFKYQDKGKGDLTDFSGQEEIYIEDKSIYKLDYRGGIISDKL